MALPKLIHLIWLGDMVADVGRAVERHQRLNPEHEVRLHRGDSELNAAYRRTYETYAKMPQLKADLIRWSLLESHGGWYFDIDCVPLVGVEAIEREYGLSGDCMFITMRGIFYNNDILAASPHWAGWPEVHAYLDGFHVPGNKVPYSCFSADVLWPHRFTRHQDTFVVGETSRFSSDGDKAPFVLRGGAGQARPPNAAQRVTVYLGAAKAPVIGGRSSDSDREVERSYAGQRSARKRCGHNS
ncbi:MAG: glycosyltransferase [Thermoguttaceae bacterium]|jgi:hypothetical protein|nr:glycosyltransferase [Thermoguttaceae bacterium]